MTQHFWKTTYHESIMALTKAKPKVALLSLDAGEAVFGSTKDTIGQAQQLSSLHGVEISVRIEGLLE